MMLLALAMQYYHTAMVLLAIGDTFWLNIGIGHRKAGRQLQEKILDHACLLFGICTSGKDVQSRLGGCYVVSVCAPWITDRAQQEGVIRMLCKIERENAWPTRALAFGAMDEWDWAEEDRRLFG